MSKLTATAIALVALMSAGISTPFLSVQAQSRDGSDRQKTLALFQKSKGNYFKPNEVLIKFKSENTSLSNSENTNKVDSYLSNKKLKRKAILRDSNTVVAELDSKDNLLTIVDSLVGNPEIEAIQPNYKYSHQTISTNDTRKTDLWGLDNTGQIPTGKTTAGTVDADIDAPEAWAIHNSTTNSVIVAVIDTGLDYNHPDFGSARLWDGASCVGYTLAGTSINGGCVYGYDYADDDKNPMASSDDHGTHVAGTIAAMANNSRGVAGVAQNAKIMALKTDFYTSEIVKAVEFAKLNGAKVINASFGGTYNDPQIYTAIAGFSGLFVAAAGNSAKNNELTGRMYPCSYSLSNIICVGATDQNDNLASFSNYGTTSVDITAPGTNILSTTYTSSVTTAYSENFESLTTPNMPIGYASNGNWGTKSINGSKVLVANKNGNYGPNENSLLYTSAINLSNAVSASTTFSVGCDTEYTPADDYLRISISNGSTVAQYDYTNEYWNDNDSIEGNNINGYATLAYSFGIPAQYLTSQFNFVFQWMSDADTLNGTSGGSCYVDNIVVQKSVVTSGDYYSYKDGTSMATPHVTGAAAYLWGFNPNLTKEEVKNLILNGADTKANLTSTIAYGRRLNLFNSLMRAKYPNGHIGNAGVDNDGMWNAGYGVSGSTDKYYPGDFDGDGKGDIMTSTTRIHNNGVLTWSLLKGTGNGFVDAGVWNSAYGVDADNYYVADFNGDGKDDIITSTTRIVNNGNLSWFFMRSDGTKFNDGGMINREYGIQNATDRYYVADFNGDGKDDIITSTTRIVNNGNLSWYFMRSTGSTYADGGMINREYGVQNTTDKYYVSDFNGDGKDDILTTTTRIHNNGVLSWYLMRSDGTRFNDGGQINNAYGVDADKYYIGDVTGDGKDDVLTSTTRVNNNGTLTWYIIRSTGTGLADAGIWNHNLGTSSDRYYVLNIGGNGNADIVRAKTLGNNVLEWHGYITQNW